MIVSSGTSNDLIENHLWRITLTATGSNPTSLKASYYDLTDDTEFLVYNITDNKASNQITGQAGIMDYYGVSGSTISFDVKNFSYSAIASDEQPSLSTVHTVFPYNTPINLTVRGNTISQVSLSDDSNGTFTPSTVNLTLANNFTSTATYTPKVAGNAELIATFEDGNSVSTDVWVIPYSVKIGFIGDSLTAANQPVIATINTLDK
ncbi:MAG: hypothetical protein LBD11_05880 [Candidatus Peribacteria bacterium]|nr:hypothetical protein [Candidatus Peribacteria bacterium]